MFWRKGGADPYVRDNSGHTAMILAAQKKYSDVVSVLRGVQRRLTADADADILMWAVQEGKVNFVNNLLNKGVDPNIQNSLGETALMWAAKEKHSDIERILLNKGADPNVRDDCGRTAFMWEEMG